MRASILAILLMSLGGCATGTQPARTLPLIEISALLSNPEQYHGQLVRTHGAAMARFEAYFICPEPAMMEIWGGGKMCLALVTSGSSDKSFHVEQLDGKTVEIVGRFDTKRFGHGGAYGGAISAVSAKILGSHDMRSAPPPPPPPPPPDDSSSNSSFKPKPLRGST